MTLLLFNNMVQSDSQIQDKKHRDESECQSWVNTLKSRRDSCLTMYVTADAKLQSLMKNRAETKQIPQETFEAVSKLSGQYMEANSAWLEAQTTLEKRKLEERKMMLQAQEVKALLRCFADFADFSDAVKRGSRISSERSFRQNGRMSAILYCMAAYCSTVSHILPHLSIQIIPHTVLTEIVGPQMQVLCRLLFLFGVHASGGATIVIETKASGILCFVV